MKLEKIQVQNDPNCLKKTSVDFWDDILSRILSHVISREKPQVQCHSHSNIDLDDVQVVSYLLSQGSDLHLRLEADLVAIATRNWTNCAPT